VVQDGNDVGKVARNVVKGKESIASGIEWGFPLKSGKSWWGHKRAWDDAEGERNFGSQRGESKSTNVRLTGCSRLAYRAEMNKIPHPCCRSPEEQTWCVA